MDEPAKIIHCPIDDCDWHIDASPPVIPENTLANVFGIGVMTTASLYQHHHKIEQQLQQHFDTHTKLDMILTIVQLRRKLGEEVKFYDGRL